mgnify:CR=1 FL=1|jgi:hypothetical protein
MFDRFKYIKFNKQSQDIVGMAIPTIEAERIPCPAFRFFYSGQGKESYCYGQGSNRSRCGG